MAEVNAALGFFEDFTDGGVVPVSELLRFDWSTPPQAQEAGVRSRALALAEASGLRERSRRTWSSIVCSRAAISYKEFVPAFRRVRLDATAQQRC